VSGQNCDCEKELNWVISTFKENDAGFQYIVDKKGINDYNRFTENILTKSQQENDIKNCQKIIEEWLNYFRKGHQFVMTFGKNDWELFPFYMPSGYKPVRLVEEKKVEEKKVEKQDSEKKEEPKDPYIKSLSNKTLYLYIPSFAASYKTKIDSVLHANEVLLKETPNLIIDIRNSRGGSDDSWSRIIPYLYTNPIRSVGMEIKATELNKEGYNSLVKMFEANNNKEMVEYCQKIITQMDEHMGNFFVPEGEKAVSIDSSYIKLPYPQKVGIICDKFNGSSDEEFLLAAKQSSKVKVFGKTTLGTLDISNINLAFSPSGIFWIGYGMSKSYRIPDFCIDDIGLQPDYFIDRSVTDWIKFTQDILEQ